jgi:hypothetical protein
VGAASGCGLLKGKDESAVPVESVNMPYATSACECTRHERGGHLFLPVKNMSQGKVRQQTIWGLEVNAHALCE